MHCPFAAPGRRNQLVPIAFSRTPTVSCAKCCPTKRLGHRCCFGKDVPEALLVGSNLRSGNSESWFGNFISFFHYGRHRCAPNEAPFLIFEHTVKDVKRRALTMVNSVAYRSRHSGSRGSDVGRQHSGGSREHAGSLAGRAEGAAASPSGVRSMERNQASTAGGRRTGDVASAEGLPRTSCQSSSASASMRGPNDKAGCAGDRMSTPMESSVAVKDTNAALNSIFGKKGSDAFNRIILDDEFILQFHSIRQTVRKEYRHFAQSYVYDIDGLLFSWISVLKACYF